MFFIYCTLKVDIQSQGRYCRGVLFMGTMTAVRYNPEMKIFYDRLKENGKHTTQAQIAVMRKMIIIAHSLYKKNEKYSSEVYKKACGSS